MRQCFVDLKCSEITHSGASQSRLLFVLLWLGCGGAWLGRCQAETSTAVATKPVAASEATAASDPAAAPRRSIERVVVTGEGLASAYGAPTDFSRSRFSPTVTAYVLPPWTVYTGLGYEGQALRFNRPAHTFTQEIELGLPHRFGVAIENSFETYRGRTQERTFAMEARYALADWNKIPLNPTVFFEYKKGIGDILRDEGAPMRGEKGEFAEMARQTTAHIPDAVEVRLLLAHDFNHKVEWALNGFFEQEIEADRGREWGFSQSFAMPVLLPDERLKIGVEMLYSNFTDKDTRSDPAHRFVIGPTLSFKPTRTTRFDVSPLFGVTHDAPRVQVFAVFSALWGRGVAGETTTTVTDSKGVARTVRTETRGGSGGEAEAPLSTRSR